ncbi:MAG: hypothetical protein CM1200mP39_28140 [Dehalococcoidia bacterium]|nr:MAG: hypothetical protein CM1200mP39_28140 [Dehalococcoidia bacterium]
MMLLIKLSKLRSSEEFSNETPKKINSGNWKMNTDVQSGINLAKQILDLSNNITNVEKKHLPAICFVYEHCKSVERILYSTGGTKRKPK